MIRSFPALEIGDPNPRGVGTEKNRQKCGKTITCKRCWSGLGIRFSQIQDSVDIKVNRFYVCLVAFGLISKILGALKTGLKLDDSDGYLVPGFQTSINTYVELASSKDRIHYKMYIMSSICKL